MHDVVEIIVASHPRWLRMIRHVVQDFAEQCGFGSRDSQAITLAVGEAAGNVIKHAYKGDDRQKLTVICTGGAGQIEIRIRDRGEAFQPDQQTIPEPNELRAGGRGLFLMRIIMDEVEYRREGDMNSVVLRKRLPAPARERA